jgi:hypothetical protein
MTTMAAKTNRRSLDGSKELHEQRDREREKDLEPMKRLRDARQSQFVRDSDPYRPTLPEERHD